MVSITRTHVKSRREPTLHTHPQGAVPVLLPERLGEPVLGGRRRPAEHAGERFLTVPVCATLPAWRAAGQAGSPMPGSTSSACSHTQRSARTTIDRAIRRRREHRLRAPSDRTNTRCICRTAGRFGPNLTITGGLRYSLYSPPYQVNGLQVAPAISMGEWFDERMRNMQQGFPSNRSPIVTFDLAGPEKRSQRASTRGTRITSRRVSLPSWSPTADRGFLRWLTGDGDLVVRGGYAKVFDRVGLGLATNFDESFAFGMSTEISSPFGAPYEDDPAVRFRGPTTLPPTVPARRPAGSPKRRRFVPASSRKASMTRW